MPYIPKDERDRAALTPKDAGELTFNLYLTCVEYSERKGRRFGVFCTVIGALVCTMLEFYRRKVCPYEDAKIQQNGDV